MSKKVVIVSGVSGQDGSHMVDYLLKNTDHLIYGCVRRLSVKNHQNISHINNERFKLVDFDLTDSHSIDNVIKTLQPDYFINFAAQSFVGSSWNFPKQTFETNATAVLDILEAIRQFAPHCRFYNAGTSEEFGDVKYSPQDENHPLRPRSPYGASKAAARHLVKVYRESYGLYAIQGWLFNHEGTRRGEEFVTRKITKGVARIFHSWRQNNYDFEPIELGNVDSRRDWSDAEDFCEGVWRMLNQEIYRQELKKIIYSEGSILLPFKVEEKNAQVLSKYLHEYVLSSNETHTIREFIEKAFLSAGIEGVWWKGLDGKPESEEYLLSYNGVLATKRKVTLVKINPKFYRPAEVELLLGNSSAARKELGWEPKVSFDQLVGKMVRNDIENFNI